MRVPEILKKLAERGRGGSRAGLAAAGVVGALAVLGGCDSGHHAAAPGRADSEPTTITALVWAPDWPQEMQEIAAAFTRAHPRIKVEVQFMIGNSVEENLKPKVAANRLPDLVSLNPNAYATRLADQGILVDVGRSAAWDNMLDQLKPDWTAPSGRHYGVAGGIAATLIYYNKEMFRKAGIGALPTNFEQFLTVCEQLKKAGYTPLVLDGAYPNMLGNGPFSYGFANNVAARQPDWREALAAGKLDLNTPEVADIFAKIKLLAARGYLQPGYMNTGYADGLKLYADGRAAMAFEGTWAAGRLMGGRVASGVFVPPWNAPGKRVVPVLGSETGFAVCDTRHREAALQFLDYLVGAGYPMQQNKRRNIPSMKQLAAPAVSDPQMTAYIAQISAAPQAVPPYYVFLPASAIELLHPLLQDVLSGKTTPQQAAGQLNGALDRQVRP
ncbi:extracellular solute-binding protein [Rugamonas sp.]|uniref:ABC transporter substrate-binding protein n=1 Tax=Rugamonas sp. TaxID=1926287 RepID=UPI0025E607E9|nr:extracellular solute-binding protein [Rugamonas sp.]